MRGGNGGDACDFIPAATRRSGHPRVQAAFGVRDDIDLFASGLAKNFIDSRRDDLRVRLNACPAVLKAIVDLGAFLFEDGRDSPPVNRPFQIPEARTVDQYDGVLCFASYVHGSLLESIFP